LTTIVRPYRVAVWSGGEPFPDDRPHVHGGADAGVLKTPHGSPSLRGRRSRTGYKTDSDRATDAIVRRLVNVRRYGLWRLTCRAELSVSVRILRYYGTCGVFDPRSAAVGSVAVLPPCQGGRARSRTGVPPRAASPRRPVASHIRARGHEGTGSGALRRCGLWRSTSRSGCVSDRPLLTFYRNVRSVVRR